MPDHLPSLELLQQMQVGLTFADERGIIRFYNSFMAEHFQRSPDMIGRHLFDYHNPVSVQKIKNMYLQFEGGRKEPFFSQGEQNGKNFTIIYQPIFRENRFIGCLELLLFSTGAGEPQNSDNVN
ncbi:MAG: hypothetical protein Kow0037_31460 [Calditrichia bacterium]